MRLAIFAALLLGCASGARYGGEPAAVPTASHVVKAGTGIDISIPYAATLLYALDGAAGELRHAAGYEALLGIDGQPAWLEAYRNARGALRAQVEDEDGWYTPLTRCSYEHADVQSFLRCAKPVAGEHAAAIETAVREADARLAPKWGELSKGLGSFGVELARSCTGPVADELLAKLRTISSLPEGAPLAFTVVLVSKPAGGKHYAHQEGPYLVLEASDEIRTGRLAAVVFHEISHLAFHRAQPAVDALEGALASGGDVGVVAGNLWEEALASAFGNGLAASKVDPKWRETDAMYADPAIDAVGHAVFERMRAGETFTLSDAMGPRIQHAVESAWPRARWRLRDVLQRVVLFADDPDLARTFSTRVRAIASYTKAPFGDDLDRAAKAPPGTPRLVLSTASTLRARKGVLSALDLSSKELDARLASAPAILRWMHDARGIPLVVLIGRDAASTRAALERWSSAERLPAAEWTPL
jgi:hypothetical protein